MPLLEIQNASVHFGGVRAVDGVTISFEAGRIHGLVGPNGSGKTTLVNAISGYATLTAGSIALADEVISGRRPDQIFLAGVSRTFQAIRLLPTLSVRENILLASDRLQFTEAVAKGWRARRSARESLADEALGKLHLSPYATAVPADLPYGIQRRVEIARAVVARPKLILLDEPFAGMSRAERDELGDILLAISAEGYTMLVIEHDLRIIHRLCDHLFVMNFGKCIAEGTTRETAALPVVQEAYLGTRHGTA